MTIVSSSFRDPSSYVYTIDNELYRHVNVGDHRLLIDSGLYDILTKKDMLIQHQEVDDCTIKPSLIPFISYPYEWCFSQLKDAALLTLAIEEEALSHNITLKDASAYNVQFINCKPIFIDTGSFTVHQKGQPWIAYRQFCQHFLAPLLLMAHKDVRLGQLLRTNIDGIPLDLASTLLPRRPSTLAHIHLHAKSQKHFGNKHYNVRMSQSQLIGIIRNLRSTIVRLHSRFSKGWSCYYEQNSYSEEAIKHKKQIVTDWIELYQPKTLWDLGGNTGLFSEIASKRNINVICFDSDPATVEKTYLTQKDFLCLIADLTNPSPSIGWHNKERASLIDRGPTDMTLALALTHHLAISNNLPLRMIAEFLSSICHRLIIEFVPKEDKQTQKLLLNRDDIFTDYNQAAFEMAFNDNFIILLQVQIDDTVRTIYMMEKR